MRQLAPDPSRRCQVVRYDLKGSSENRKHKPPRPGRKMQCRHFCLEGVNRPGQSHASIIGWHPGGWHEFTIPRKGTLYPICRNNFTCCAPNIVYKDADLGLSVHFAKLQFHELCRRDHDANEAARRMASDEEIQEVCNRP